MNEFKNKIGRWLKDSGYPLEMKVAKVMRDLGFNTLNSVYYDFKDEGRHREIDVASFKYSTDENMHHVLGSSFNIECKSISDKPWVFFGVKKNWLKDKTRFSSIPHTDMFCKLHKNIKQDENKWEYFILYHTLQTYGGTVALRENNRDDIFAALMSATTAAIAEKEKFEKSTHFKYCTIHFPVVVTAAPLFIYYLDENGKETLDEAQWVQCVAGVTPFDNQKYCVDVVTEMYFPEYANLAHKFSEFIISTGTPVLENIKAENNQFIDL
jgi:hypothetical protein